MPVRQVIFVSLFSKVAFTSNTDSFSILMPFMWKTSLLSDESWAPLISHTTKCVVLQVNLATELMGTVWLWGGSTIFGSMPAGIKYIISTNSQEQVMMPLLSASHKQSSFTLKHLMVSGNWCRSSGIYHALCIKSQLQACIFQSVGMTLCNSAICKMLRRTWETFNSYTDIYITMKWKPMHPEDR